MRILQINAVNQIGSTGRNVSEMNLYMRKEGHICASAFSTGPSVNPEWEYHIGSRVDVKMHGLLSRLSGKQGYYSKKATQNLLEYISSFAPDIVVLNNLHANYINFPMLMNYLAENDTATVAVLHDCWFYTGKCCYYSAIHCERWRENCGHCPGLRRDNRSWIFDRSQEMLADKVKLFGSIPRLGVVGVSKWLTKQARTSVVFQHAKAIECIYNWIDDDIFTPQNKSSFRHKMRLAGKKILLGVSSVWSERKGIDTMLKLADSISEDQQLVLVGLDPGRRLVHPNIISIPETNNVAELATYYSMADVFVQPSLEETFGKVTAEALMCGTPVVCYNATATPELVGPGCGTVVPVGDVQAMNNAIQQILKQGKEAFSPNCRNYAVEHFQKGKNLKEYLNLFETLCKY